ncbi:Rieske (2Fe-2S) protein [Hoeflea sp.]|uniref:Rieske (2Fe-2S) protein n=1 Tax=Hoeflea sp. TaxID=1940281 RepID=UPI0019AD8D1D|nr:Rieske (2Fe-2S) protein [Hoeflea sp.]MBC7285909.1 Rieske (2Fe-2S) protein [Hoeflea sp.]
MTETFLCRPEDLPEHGVRIVEIGDIEIGVIRHEGALHAYRNVCPHQGGPVCEGVRIAKVRAELDEQRRFSRHDFDADEMHIVCPWHGWEFRLDTGEAAGDPAIRLHRYDVVERDGGLYVEI